MPPCPKCQNDFTPTDFEKNLLQTLAPKLNNKTFDLPFPTLCPACRSQRRLSFRNELALYKRKCDFTQENIISIYSTGKPHKIYKTDIWWTDKWNPLDPVHGGGKAYDFNQTFTSQFASLLSSVPRPSLTTAALENSPYVNQVWHSKNAYMCFDGGFSEDALYCGMVYHSKNVADCLSIRECELSYNLIDCHGCYNCLYLQNSKNCTDSYFCFDCQGCNNIAFCSNLRNKSRHILNKPVSEDEFRDFVKKMDTGSHKNLQNLIKDFHEKVITPAIHKLNYNLNIENCTGNYLSNSKNCHHCFDADKCEDVEFGNRLDEKITNSAHVDHCAICELAYECMCVNGVRMLFCTNSYNDSSECLYCDYVMSSANCFGCVGLRHKQYCIFNKQYTREEYEELVPRIIEHMKSTGEWGQFFDPSISPFDYNETVANDYFPKNPKPQASSKPPVDFPGNQAPDHISKIDDSIINEILKCHTCGKSYKIVIQELKFYKKHDLPIPRQCFSCRHQSRINQRNPRKPWPRKCSKCCAEIQTSYAPDRDLKVYCENCYFKEVY